MRRITPVVLTFAVAFAGCKAKEAIEQAKIASELAKSGSTTKLLNQAAEDKYESPNDGKLTDNQVQMYLKVREREKLIAQEAKKQLQQHSDDSKKAGEKSIAGMVEGFKGLGSVADFLTADIRAAKDLGYNTAEYQWVKGQILAASTSAMGQQVATAMNAQMDATYAQVKKSYDEAKDEQTKAMYKETLDSLDQQKKDQAANKEQEDPALTYNRQLLSKYENVLNAYAAELSKYEDKKGDAEKQVQDFKNSVDAAKQKQ